MYLEMSFPMYLYMHLLQPPANLTYLTHSYPSIDPQQDTGSFQGLEPRSTPGNLFVQLSAPGVETVTIPAQRKKDDAAAKPPAGFIFTGPPTERTIPAQKHDTPQDAQLLDKAADEMEAARVDKAAAAIAETARAKTRADQKAADLDAARVSKEEADRDVARVAKAAAEVDASGDVSRSASDTDANASDDDFEDNPDSGSLQRQYLMTCGRLALKKLAKEKGLKVSGNAKNSTLIQLLLQHVRSANTPPSPTLPYDHRPFASSFIVQMYLAILFGMDLFNVPYNVSQYAPSDVPLQCTIS